MDNVTPYEGSEPYIFLSYAHADSAAVMAVAARLQEVGCRVWYDGGIEVGSEWPEYIAAHLEGAAVMLAFLSNAYVRSDNCRKEMHFAQTRKISTVNIFLEETALTPGMEMQIGPLFALMKYSMGEDVFYDKLLAAPQLAPFLGQEREAFKTQAKPVRGKKHWTGKRIAALCVSLALLIAVVTLGIIGLATGYAQRIWIKNHLPEIPALSGDTEVVFTDRQLDTAARTYTGISEGPLQVSDLAGLDVLTLESPAADTLSELRYFPDLKHLTAAVRRGEADAARLPPDKSQGGRKVDASARAGHRGLPHQLAWRSVLLSAAQAPAPRGCGRALLCPAQDPDNAGRSGNPQCGHQRASPPYASEQSHRFKLL